MGHLLREIPEFTNAITDAAESTNGGGDKEGELKQAGLPERFEWQGDLIESSNVSATGIRSTLSGYE